jgi:predicted amidohydrolase
MYVAASLSEREGHCLYNTGVLIDREGRIVGKYRKTHLTIGESLVSGKTPGNEYPVFETDFGRVGYMICYDNHFPEVARALAIQGADVIVFSNMGDGRENGILWEPYIQTRALDNQVHIVAAVNGGRSCIVSPRGEILSIVDKTRGAIAIARCDLDVTVRNYSGREIGKRYMQVRRSDTFGILRHEYRQEAPRPLAEKKMR